MAMTLIRFGLVGLLNTAIGFAVILFALRMGAGDYTANATGYIAGLALSYMLNRSWTFGVTQPVNPAEFARFMGAFALSYAANLLLITAGKLAGFGGNPLLHLGGVLLYSALFFGLSQAFAFRNARSRCDPKHILPALTRYAPELALVFIALVTWLALHGLPFTHDVVWQFWIAQKLLDGAALYRDIWEINPPLWFWSAVPIQYAANLAEISPFDILLPVVIAMGALSAILLGNLPGTLSPLRRALIMVLAFGLYIIVPLYDFGQREQIALIWALPYAALIARRFSGSSVPASLAASVGGLAAFGFALKHYFALVPILLELWLLVGAKRNWRPFRPETVALAACAVAYVASILYFTPDFLENIVPMVATAYHGYEGSWEMLLIRPWIMTWSCIAALLLLLRADIAKRGEPLIAALLVVAFAFALSYFLQRKGWLYHSIPVTGALGVALGLSLVRLDMRKMIAGLPILALPFILPIKTGPYFNLLDKEMKPALSTVPRGEAVFVASADPMWAWPAVEERGLVWPSRLYAFWMIPAIAHAEIIGPNPDPLRKLAIEIQNEAALEIRCSRPALIVFERRRNYIHQPTAFNVRDFFLRNEDIRAFLNWNYREMESTPSLYLYRRVTDPGSPRDQVCPMVSRI